MHENIEIRDLPLGVAAFRRQAEGFLTGHGLRLEPLDYYAGLFAGDRMLAGGGFAGGVIKCVAASESARGLGLINTLVTHLRQLMLARGCTNIFVFTKPENEGIFRSLSFYSVGRAPKAVLLESDSRGVERFISTTCQALPGGSAACIVMNCNPFTLGHQFLVQTAARASEHLAVFVVEEERSQFPFAARLALARAGCAHLTNVTVLPGGPYIISNATFPSYFLKQAGDAAATHARLDLDIFAHRLAPGLNITARYAGDEPLDELTRQYNAAMLEILPPAGVDVRIIARKESGGAPISASRVRALIAEGRLDETRALVPDGTYEYIVNHFPGGAK